MFLPNFFQILPHNKKHVTKFFICFSQHDLASFGYFDISYIGGCMRLQKMFCTKNVKNLIFSTFFTKPFANSPI
jgi:hypothetical protein